MFKQLKKTETMAEKENLPKVITVTRHKTSKKKINLLIFIFDWELESLDYTVKIMNNIYEIFG